MDSTEVHADTSHARSILVGFAVGEAIAAPYDPWSIAPASSTLALALEGPSVLAVTGLTVQLCETVRSLARDRGDARHLWSDLATAYRSAPDLVHPRAIADLFDRGAEPGTRTDGTDGSAVVRGVAAGLVAGSPYDAFRAGVDQASVTHSSPVVGDAAGVVTFATWARSRNVWGSRLAEVVVGAPVVTGQVQDVLVAFGGGSVDSSPKRSSRAMEAVAILERTLDAIRVDAALEALTRAARRSGRSSMAAGLATALAPPPSDRELVRLADRLRDGRQVARAIDALTKL